jgi:hypothetical protein
MSDDELKVIEGKFGKQEPESASASDILQAASDFMTTMEDESGVDAEVVVVVQMKGVPTIQYSNAEMDRMATILDFAKWDLVTAMVNADYAEVHGEEEDDDPSIH